MENVPGSGNGNDVNLTGNRDQMYASDAEPVNPQGQLISERLLVSSNFQKKPCKNLMNFCPRI